MTSREMYFCVIPNCPETVKLHAVFEQLECISQACIVGVHRNVPRRWIFQHLGGHNRQSMYKVLFFDFYIYR